MNNILKITEIIKNNNKIEIEYIYNEKWKKYLYGNNFFTEYNKNIEKVPNSIAIIPLLVNILPISWVFDLTIEVDELDNEFYDSIPQIITGYEKMYPNIEFKNNIKVNKIIKNKKNESTNTASLFSGGVDAYCTLLRHIKENIDLITIFGADIKLNDNNGINRVNTLNSKIAKDFNKNYITINSNFREIVNYHNLYKEMVNLKIKGEWWHEFQHGIGLIGLVAPIAYINNYKTVYIASSYSFNQKGQYTCASDPIIDNKLKYNNTQTIHDGYELSRQDKIKYICKTRKELNINQIKLRVCWESSGGENCCQCEKCYRTIMGLIAEKEDPNNYNFNFNSNVRKRMMKYLKEYLSYDIKNLNKPLYIPIKTRFLQNYNYETIPNDLKWFINIEIGKKDPTLYIIKNKVLKKIKKLINMKKDS